LAFSSLFASAATIVSDATEDSGFHIGENLSTVDIGAGTGDDAMESIYLLFKNWPDLSGQTISSARLEVYTGTIAPISSHEDLLLTYVAVAGAWDDVTSTYSNVDALSMGSDTGQDLLVSSSGVWNYLDLTVALQTIYAADPTPADITIKLTNSFWQAALTPDDEIAGLEFGDRGGGDGYVQFQHRGQGNYPRITIVYSSSGKRSAGTVGLLMAGRMKNETTWNPDTGFCRGWTYPNRGPLGWNLATLGWRQSDQNSAGIHYANQPGTGRLLDGYLRRPYCREIQGLRWQYSYVSTGGLSARHGEELPSDFDRRN